MPLFKIEGGNSGSGGTTLPAVNSFRRTIIIALAGRQYPSQGFMSSRAAV